jgi:hypothetical protein
MAPGSTTHHSDMAQRYISLPILQKKPTSIRFRGPIDARLAPRGIYMLFLVTSSRAVSDATFVFLP